VPPWKCSNWSCVEEEPVWGTGVIHDRLCKSLDICFSKHTKTTHPRGDAPLRQCVLPRLDTPNHALEGVQLMSCDCIIGTARHYMPLESFLNFRNSERMIAKIKLPIPIHLLDQIIIPINVRESHWFPAHTTNPMYQPAGLKPRLQRCHLSTTKNARSNYVGCLAVPGSLISHTVWL